MARTIRPILTMLVLSLAALPSGAQTLEDYDYANLSFRGVGIDWGTIWPDKVDATGAWSLRFDLGFLGPAVRIMPTLSYWSSRMKSGELQSVAERLNQLPALQEQGVTLTREDLGTVDWSDVSLTIDTHAVFTLPWDVITYVGAGVGVHALNGRGSAIEETFIEDLLDTVTAGVAVMTGAEYDIARNFRLYGELRYTLASDVRYPGFRFGGALMLPGGTAATQQAVGGR